MGGSGESNKATLDWQNGDFMTQILLGLQVQAFNRQQYAVGFVSLTNTKFITPW